jgi:transposase
MFFEDVLSPLMAKAKTDDVILLFADAAHFVMGCDFLGWVYGKTRRFIRTYSGRKRYNVLGAINFISKKMTCITNDTYITSKEICLLLQCLADEYIGKPIYLVLDNARYQKCIIVQTLADQLGIQLVYIPPYSPNLNLIERLWKHVKSKLRTKCYGCFDVFKEKIDSIVYATSGEDKKFIDRLISDKVQLFDDTVDIVKTHDVRKASTPKQVNTKSNSMKHVA